MKDVGIGQQIQDLRVGDRTVHLAAPITVTAANQAIIGDGDIDAADLERLRGNDGDRSTISAADFQAAGFDPAAFELLAPALEGVAAGMGTVRTTPAGAVPTTADLTLSSRTFVTAAQQYVNRMGPQMAEHRTFVDTHRREGVTVTAAGATPGSDSAQRFATKLAALPEGERTQVRDSLIQIATRDPNTTQANAISILQNLGFSEADAGRMVRDGRMAAQSEINSEAMHMFRLEGGGVPVASYVIATGDGSNTSSGFIGNARGIVPYSEHAEINGDGAITNCRSQTMPIAVADPTAPMTFHLTAGGTNGGGAELSIHYGGQDYALSITGNGQITGAGLPPGVTFTPVPARDGGGVLVSFPNPAGTDVSVTQTSRRLPSEGMFSAHPWDEVFTRVTATNVAVPTRTAEPPPTVVVPTHEPEPLPDPPPATDGVGAFRPNHIDLLPGSEAANNIDTMAAWLTAHPQALQGLTLDLESLGTVHNGEQVRQVPGTYGTATLGGETLTQANTAGDRRSSFGLSIQGGHVVISGRGSADPLRATVQVTNRTALTQFMTAHPNLHGDENHALGALREFALLQAFQTNLNDRLRAAGQPAVDLLSTAQVRLQDGTSMNYQQYQQMTGR